MAVCGFDMIFTFVWPGWEGTAYDTRIFLEALRNKDIKFPKWYVLFKFKVIFYAVIK